LAVSKLPRGYWQAGLPRGFEEPPLGSAGLPAGILPGLPPLVLRSVPWKEFVYSLGSGVNNKGWFITRNEGVMLGL
jgi:hypothetical protein